MINLQVLHSDEQDVCIECQICGEVFLVNYTEALNVEWSNSELNFVIKCPKCGITGIN